jgi:hypothetical protein
MHITELYDVVHHINIINYSFTNDNKRLQTKLIS